MPPAPCTSLNLHLPVTTCMEDAAGGKPEQTEGGFSKGLPKRSSETFMWVLCAHWVGTTCGLQPPGQWHCPPAQGTSLPEAHTSCQPATEQHQLVGKVKATPGKTKGINVHSSKAHRSTDTRERNGGAPPCPWMTWMVRGHHIHSLLRLFFPLLLSRGTCNMVGRKTRRA